MVHSVTGLQKFRHLLIILERRLKVYWPENGDGCSLMTNTKLCKKHIHLQSSHRQNINISVVHFSHTGHFSSHHLNHGGKLNSVQTEFYVIALEDITKNGHTYIFGTVLYSLLAHY